MTNWNSGSERRKRREEVGDRALGSLIFLKKRAAVGARLEKHGQKVAWRILYVLPSFEIKQQRNCFEGECHTACTESNMGGGLVPLFLLLNLRVSR